MVEVNELCRLGVAGLAELLRCRKLYPVHLVEICLARIAQLDGGLHAFVTVAVAKARARAILVEKELAAGNWRGPLHGIPFGAKDLLASGAIPSEVGMPLFRGCVTDRSATAVTRMERAGPFFWANCARPKEP